MSASARKLLGLLGKVQRRNRVLPDGFLILVAQFRVALAHDLAHAQLRQLLRHRVLAVEQPPLERGLVLHEGGDHFVQILAADAAGFGACGLHQAIDLEVDLAALLVDTDVRSAFRVAVWPVVEALPAPLHSLGVKSKRGANTCSISRLAAIAFSVSFMASTTAASAASGSAIRLVKRARSLPGASRVARPMICTISVRLLR